MGLIRRINGNRNSLSIIGILIMVSLLLIISGLTAFINSSPGSEKPITVQKDSYIGSEGIIYEDLKNINYKSYFDFKSKANLLLCFDPGCKHSSDKCTARQGHPYSIYLDGKLFYIETNMVTYTDYSQAVISCLYKSNDGSRGYERVAEFEGGPVGDVYIKDNILYMIVTDYKPAAGGTTKTLYYLCRINLKKNSIVKTNIALKGGFNESYTPMGLAADKIILYHRYYDKIISPSDYGLEGDIIDYNKDKESYDRYRKELMQVFHEDMYSLDLSSGKSEYLPLAVPLLIHDGLYYYNKQQNNGHYCLMAYDIGTNGEKEILNYPAYSIDAFNNTLFITEGTERLGDVTAGIIIDLDINSTKYYLINTAVGEAVELSEAFFKGTDAQIKLIAEYEDYYIFIYSSLNEGISRRIGYIRKNDFLNGSDKYILAAPM